MENFNTDQLTGMDIELDGEVRQQLYDAGKWAKFISIVMFIACGLLLLFGTIGAEELYTAFRRLSTSGGVFGELNGAIIMILVILAVAILAFVYYFLFNFSRKIKTALISENTAELNAALRSLKIFFIITTVFSILSLLNSVYKLF